MNRGRVRQALGVLALGCICLLGHPQAAVAGLEELEVKRQEIFEFTEKPKLTADGDKVTIAFASRAFCDATVAVEDATGRILRHLASGVLGPNAPAPFQKDSLKQAIAWDGKDDRGEYVGNRESCTVRVSLGLEARFERTLYWSPHKRQIDPKIMLGARQLAVAAPQGVYLYEGDNVRLYDHDGNYLRTIYPFPASTIDRIRGIDWATLPPGEQKFPVKRGKTFDTLLSCSLPADEGLWTIGDTQYQFGRQATAMAAHGDRVFLVGQRLNRLPAKDPAGPFELEGPRIVINSGNVRHDPPRLPIASTPCSAAVSPDGKWLYMTHYPGGMTAAGNYGGYRTLQAVTRMAVDGGEPPVVFIGEMKLDAAGAGQDDAHFNFPRCVTVDAKGRLYVADYLNQRVQVFDAEGKFLRSIACRYPTEVRVSPKTGEIYVFSWSEWTYRHEGKTFRPDIEPMLFRLGTLDDPKNIASLTLKDYVDFLRQDMNTVMPAAAEIDFATTPPTIWLTRKGVVSWKAPRVESLSPLLLVERDGRLAVKRDFAKDAEQAAARIRPPRHARQRLYVNPADGCVFVGEHYDPAPIHMKSFAEMVRVDPMTGRCSLVPLPCTAEDFAFDWLGRAYFRAGFGDREPMGAVLGRWDIAARREIPFDYGEEHKAISYQGYGQSPAASVIVSASRANESSQFGGIAVSPRGHIAAAFYNPTVAQDRRDAEGKLIGDPQLKPYHLKLYPGRSVECFIHIWDEHGKLLHEDAVPGVGRTTSIAIDREDNLYLMAVGQRMYDGKPHPAAGSGTLVKVKPGAARFVSSSSARVPIPAEPAPKRPPDLGGTFGAVWAEGAEWLFGGIGLDGKSIGRCHCENTTQMAVDCFGRCFAPEVHRCDVVVVDSAGNAVLRIGRYGNVEDGRPLVASGGPPEPRSIGADEVALFRGNFVGTQTDRRLFIGDVGNSRVVSVRLTYHATEKVPLK